MYMYVLVGVSAVGPRDTAHKKNFCLLAGGCIYVYIYCCLSAVSTVIFLERSCCCSRRGEGEVNGGMILERNLPTKVDSKKKFFSTMKKKTSLFVPC